MEHRLKHFEELCPEAPAEKRSRGLDYLHDVELGLSVELGRASIAIRDLLGLQAGSVLELEALPTDPLVLRANGRIVARGEVVVVNDKFGIRITEVVSPEGEEG